MKFIQATLKFLRVWKAFVRITEEPFKLSQYFQNHPNFSRWFPIFRIISKLSGFFQMTANFLDYFKTVWIFQTTATFPDYFKTVRIFQMTDNFPDYYKTVRIFPDDCQFSRLFQNCPDFSRWLPIFRMISKLSRFFQMIANFLDDFKTVRIFPDEGQFFGWFQKCPNFSRCRWEEGVPKMSSNKIAQRTGIFGPINPFAFISALFGLFHGRPFLAPF